MDFSTINTSIANPGTTTSANGTKSTSTPTLAEQASNTQQTFLKLLVAQMNNQDPTNPMDNSQLTTQMAQIETVSGISTLTTTVSQLSSQFSQMQNMQGASLIGQNVLIEGNDLDMNASGGGGTGTFNLASAADKVEVTITDASGNVVGTKQLGALSAGQHNFDWSNSSYGAGSSLTYSITATANGAAVTSTTYSEDKVVSVNTSGSTLQLQLAHLGTVPYSSVQYID